MADAITITLEREQADYVRELLFDDLEKWADTLADMAKRAGDSQGRNIAAADAEDMSETGRRAGAQRPTMALLDIVGWHTGEACAVPDIAGGES
jgi:hypothetical protein